MTNPFINNFIASEQQRYQNIPAQKPAFGTPNTIVHPISPAPAPDPASRGFKSYILPEVAQRGLVNENYVQRKISNAKALGKTYKYFADAVIDGKGTDYTVGRINDGAKILGSLGIAAALSSTASTPKNKLMEFVGFATWFGAMSVWPEILYKGIKVSKGVDLNQNYVDSYGRRKRFAEDSQYLTWDLYDKKTLHKMGDKLGVPKNIENREEAIQEKAKQVIVQGNTLMLLSAGFVTPVATALVCNALERPISAGLEAVRVNAANKIIKPLEGNELLISDKKAKAEFIKFIGGESGTLLLDKKGVEGLHQSFENNFITSGLEAGLKKDLESSLLRKEVMAAVTPEELHKTVFGEEPLRGILKEVLGNSHDDKLIDGLHTKISEKFTLANFNNFVTESGGIEHDSRSSLLNTIGAVLNQNLRKHEDDFNLNDDHMKQIGNKISDSLSGNFEKAAGYEYDRAKLVKLFNKADNFKTRSKIIGKFANATYGNAADSIRANIWEKYAPEVIDALGFNKKQIAEIAKNKLNVQDVIKERMLDLAKNETEYKKAAEKLAKVAMKIVKKESVYTQKGTALWESLENDLKQKTETTSRLKDIVKTITETDGLKQYSDELFKALDPHSCDGRNSRQEIINTQFREKAIGFVVDKYNDGMGGPSKEGREWIGKINGIQGDINFDSLINGGLNKEIIYDGLKNDVKKILCDKYKHDNDFRKGLIGKIDGIQGMVNAETLGHIGLDKDVIEKFGSFDDKKAIETYIEKLTNTRDINGDFSKIKHFPEIVNNVTGVLAEITEKEPAHKETLKPILEKIKEAVEFKNLDNDMLNLINVKKLGVADQEISTKSSWFRHLLALDRSINAAKNPNDEMAIAARDIVLNSMGIDHFSNKFEHLINPKTGLPLINSSEEFVKVLGESFNDLKHILQGNEHTETRKAINEFHKDIMLYLGQIDGANRPLYISKLNGENSLKKALEELKAKNKFLFGEGDVTRDRSNWTNRTGKNFHEFIIDACSSRFIKNNWLKKAVILGASVVGVSAVAVSTFGKKNEYNPDVYIPKNTGNA